MCPLLLGHTTSVLGLGSSSSWAGSSHPSLLHDVGAALAHGSARLVMRAALDQEVCALIHAESCVCLHALCVQSCVPGALLACLTPARWIQQRDAHCCPQRAHGCCRERQVGCVLQAAGVVHPPHHHCFLMLADCSGTCTLGGADSGAWASICVGHAAAAPARARHGCPAGRPAHAAWRWRRRCACPAGQH
jgi:hypothetical protein